MKVLYVGLLKPGGTCFDRFQALQRLGYEVICVDQARYDNRFKMLRSIQWRLQPRRLVEAFNREILRVVESTRGLMFAWIDKGVWVFPETIYAIKHATQCTIIHYTPDAQLLSNRSRHFDSSIGIYDHLVTTKSFEVDMYLSAGAKNVILCTQSYCPIRFAEPRFDSRFACDIGFIGDYKPYYARVINHLSTKFEDVAVWGPNWRRAKWRGRIPPGYVPGGGLWESDYVNALSSFKIGLGLLSKFIPEQRTSRSFEIPAAGCFLLAERTGEHQEYFEEGKEAEFFESNAELVDKARFYLANDSARSRIARRGKRRCEKSGYDTDSVIGEILLRVQREGA